MKGLRYCSAFLLAAVWVVSLHAQEPGGTIRGRVTDGTSQLPLRGATVSALGPHRRDPRRRRLSADRRAHGDGQRAGHDDRLRAEHPGGRDRSGQTLDLDFALTAQAVNLAEMVVVGYGEQRQGNIAGAVTNVTSEEFNTGRVVSPQRADPE